MANTGMQPVVSEDDEELICLKERCRKIKEHILNSCSVQEEFVKTLDSRIPNFSTNLDLSMKIIYAFKGLEYRNEFKAKKIKRWDSDSNLGNKILAGGASCLENQNARTRIDTGTPDQYRPSDVGPRPMLHGHMRNPGFRGAPVSQVASTPHPLVKPHPSLVPPPLRTHEDDMKEIEALLKRKSVKEILKSKADEEFYDLIHRPTVRETAIAFKFKTKGDAAAQLKEYCEYITKTDCRSNRFCIMACQKVHFRRIIAPHTDTSLGDCTYLDNCRRMKFCRYVHYELDSIPDTGIQAKKPLRAEYCSEIELGEAQWISCDIRTFRMDILGQFGVIMADPPWDIHMELPYGTMTDDEVRNLNVPILQTDGVIFLWVTGRAMELGRECLEIWGYKRVEEVIWVKVNQLQRLIVTGRTGHWLNHSKEHCLVGIKGNPELNRNIDTDVLVSEIREVSRKPDEIYAMLERISPGTRKLELFARMHNTHPGWLSLGNQLNGVRFVDDGLKTRFSSAYPDVEVQP